MNEKTQKGLLTELHCQQAFTELGIMLSAPIISDNRYDFIANINGNLIRIQCKTCTYDERRDVITFSTRSIRGTTQGNYERKYNKDEIDFFYTYYNNYSYLVPVEECNSAKTLHLKERPLNNNTINVNFAKDYELKNQLKKIFSLEIKEGELNPIITKIENYCIDCNRPITKGAIRCRKCNFKYISQKSIIPISREELKKLIRKETFVSIGKSNGVTDNAIKKWCKKYNLPSTKKEINNYSDEEWNQI